MMLYKKLVVIWGRSPIDVKGAAYDAVKCVRDNRDFVDAYNVEATGIGEDPEAIEDPSRDEHWVDDGFFDDEGT
jgi:hypothetical protein